MINSAAADGKRPPGGGMAGRLVVKYEEPSLGRAVWQLTTTLGSYALLWDLMYWSVAYFWWLTLPMAVLAGALLVRVFIIFHDCGHGSFFIPPAPMPSLVSSPAC